MKRYEAVYDQHLTPNSPVIVRVDGRAFHTFLRGAARPFDHDFIDAMSDAAIELANDMQGFKLAYVQSDEATFCITDYDRIESDGWFDYSLSKIVSISASVFSLAFNRAFGTTGGVFDARAFVIPEDDAPNVFVWRQRDWTRNSVQMYARYHYSHKELVGKKSPDMHEMLYAKGCNWANLRPVEKNGTFILPDETRIHGQLSYSEIKALIKPKELNGDSGSDPREDVGEALATESADVASQA
jgi:tRNA(His) 5'-end guanylyltransferase